MVLDNILLNFLLSTLNPRKIAHLNIILLGNINKAYEFLKLQELHKIIQICLTLNLCTYVVVTICIYACKLLFVLTYKIKILSN